MVACQFIKGAPFVLQLAREIIIPINIEVFIDK